MSQNNTYTAPPRVKNFFDHKKLVLRAPTPGVQGKTANLTFNLFSNMPRITVYTNDPQDKDNDRYKGKISANLDPLSFCELIHHLNTAADTDGPFKEKIENKGTIWYGKDKPSEKPEVISTTHIWKDKEGVICISVVAPENQNRPRIAFQLLPDTMGDGRIGEGGFHTYIHGDGTPWTPAELSKLRTKSYAKLMTVAMEKMMVENYAHPEPKKPNNQNGQNNNRSGGGGGGYQQRQSQPADDDVMDDIPF